MNDWIKILGRILVVLGFLALRAYPAESRLFEQENDIGQVSHAGSATYERGARSLVVALLLSEVRD